MLVVVSTTRGMVGSSIVWQEKDDDLVGLCLLSSLCGRHLGRMHCRSLSRRWRRADVLGMHHLPSSPQNLLQDGSSRVPPFLSRCVPVGSVSRGCVHKHIARRMQAGSIWSTQYTNHPARHIHVWYEAAAAPACCFAPDRTQGYSKPEESTRRHCQYSPLPHHTLRYTQPRCVYYILLCSYYCYTMTITLPSRPTLVSVPFRILR